MSKIDLAIVMFVISIFFSIMGIIQYLSAERTNPIVGCQTLCGDRPVESIYVDYSPLEITCYCRPSE